MEGLNEGPKFGSRVPSGERNWRPDERWQISMQNWAQFQLPVESELHHAPIMQKVASKTSEC